MTVAASAAASAAHGVRNHTALTTKACSRLDIEADARMRRDDESRLPE